jgi:hypothetical protein
MALVDEAGPACFVLRLRPDILPGFRSATPFENGAEADAGSTTE